MANKKTPSYSDIQSDGITKKAPLTRGERLKKELKKAGFTHAEFAERMGYATKSISNYCTGNRWIPDENIPRIAEIINERLRKQGDYVSPEYLAGRVNYRNENERLEIYNKKWYMEADNVFTETYQKQELSKAFQVYLSESGYVVLSCIISDWAEMLKSVHASSFDENDFFPVPCNIDKYSSQSDWISGESPSPDDIAETVSIISSFYSDIIYCIKTPVGELKTLTHAELMHMYESAKTILGALFAGIIDRPGNDCSRIKQELIPLAKLPDLLE